MIEKVSLFGKDKHIGEIKRSIATEEQAVLKSLYERGYRYVTPSSEEMFPLYFWSVKPQKYEERVNGIYSYEWGYSKNYWESDKALPACPVTRFSIDALKDIKKPMLLTDLF